MGTSRTDLFLVLAVGLVALAGLFDSWVIEEPDLVVLFATVLVLCSALLTRWLLRRQVRIRTDLARWLQRRSDLTGEPVGQIADRALATYRQQLGEEDDMRTDGNGTPGQPRTPR